jgi:hypothetical protein
MGLEISTLLSCVSKGEKVLVSLEKVVGASVLGHVHASDIGASLIAGK